MSCKVLVVEDKEVILELYNEFLDILGYQALCVQSAELAIEILSEENISFVISDLNMPKVNGLKFYETICQKWPNLASRVVIVTGRNPFSKLENQAKARGIPMYYKPVTVDKLKEILEQYCIID